MMRTGGERHGSSSSGSRCQDCGNQAKKDCRYMRCRTCCNGKEFQCQTHVKSTWIPAHRRRQRMMHQQQQHQQLLHLPLPLPLPTFPTPAQQNPKRLRDSTSTNPPRTLLFPGDLPPEISSHATFKCVRVTSMEDQGGEGDEPVYAYQTSVSIGGHVFKGILYDQGPNHEARTEGSFHHHESATAGENTSPRGDILPQEIATTSAVTAAAGSNQAPPAEHMYICPYPFTFASPIIHHGSHIFPPPKS
ncbi:hypothetical protein MLD38_013865 [Melastoma candidum]|uniref:Uncharacterized protein n=1 Tax=Melastoma candidum TaxID=119954 RepID=A0ACB9RE24_9MYRT|nr:hypothetical protein MLD38_013865 [Melastoma candidum]